MKKINQKKVILFCIDTVLLIMSVVASLLIITTIKDDTEKMYQMILLFGDVFVPITLVFMMIFRAYRGVLRFATSIDFIRVTVSVLCGGAVGAVFTAILVLTNKSSDLLEPSFIAEQKKIFLGILLAIVFALCSTVGARMIYCAVVLLRRRKRTRISTKQRKRTMIVGGGETCKLILGEMEGESSIYEPICIMDDNSNKISRRINDIPVYGPTEIIPDICEKFNIELIIFAIPSCEPEDKQRILNICHDTGKETLVIPNLSDLILHSNDMKLLNQVKALNMEDLLGREAIKFDKDEVKNLIKDKVCMVTGGGGSIGSELCRQIAKNSPKSLIIVDIYENNAYDIQQELIRKYGDRLNLHTHIASVRDYNKMNELFKRFKPDIVFHAAAHKHVPLMETSPEEAIKNNVFGTFNCAMLADFYEVKKFVLISTDKAVNPTNIMGASKRICEMIVQYMAQVSKSTDFVAVRFGNVLGSNGSVIPLFRKQIEKGGPVTVTHPDIIRYFMTIPEAVSLVLQAGNMAKGSEIFVLDMGKPVKITTLAENLIRIYGYEPYTDIKIEFTGLRPGEKLFEELLMDEEGLKKTGHDKIFVGNQIQIDKDTFINQLTKLKEVALANKSDEVVKKVAEIVPTFNHKINEKQPVNA